MAATNEEEATRAGGPGWIVVGLAVVVALLAGGAGAYFFLAPDPEARAMEARAEAEAAAEEERAAYRERVLTLEPFVVNISGDDYPRYLKVKIDLEADSPRTVSEIDARLAQVRDAVIVLLSSKRLSDVTDFDGKVLLKEDLRDRINAILDDGAVSSVYFTEFVVQ